MNHELKKELVDVLFKLGSSGLVKLTWGNASVIDREKNLIAIKPSGLQYSDITIQTLVILSIDGRVIEGDLRPSSDTNTHLELYRNFSEIGSIIHTHSPFATAFSQANKTIPCLGTTHADNFYGDIPIIPALSLKEVEENYEHFIGVSIVKYFRDNKINPMELQAALLAHHGPFVWGRDLKKAYENSIVLEECAKIAFATLQINSNLNTLPQYYLDEHYLRKNGKKSRYGQIYDSSSGLEPN